MPGKENCINNPICFYLVIVELSCMIDGMGNEDTIFVKYYEGQEFKDILKSFFEGL
jgi:hypothetical protein